MATRAAFPLQVREVRYEDVVADLPSEARDVIAFLGLDWTDDVLTYREKARARAIDTPSVAQVIEPVYQSAMQKWRHYEPHMAPILGRLAPWAARFGYE